MDRDDLSVDRDVDRDRYGLEQRDREPSDRDDDRSSTDPRDVFMRDFELPHGDERELVRDRDCEYTLRGSETRDHARTSDSGIQVHAEARGDGEREYSVACLLETKTEEHHAPGQPALVPFGTGRSGQASTGVTPSAYPRSNSIPSDITPFKRRGSRFTTKSA